MPEKFFMAAHNKKIQELTKVVQKSTVPNGEALNQLETALTNVPLTKSKLFNQFHAEGIPNQTALRELEGALATIPLTQGNTAETFKTLHEVTGNGAALSHYCDWIQSVLKTQPHQLNSDTVCLPLVGCLNQFLLFQRLYMRLLNVQPDSTLSAHQIAEMQVSREEVLRNTKTNSKTMLAMIDTLRNVLKHNHQFKTDYAGILNFTLDAASRQIADLQALSVVLEKNVSQSNQKENLVGTMLHTANKARPLVVGFSKLFTGSVEAAAGIALLGSGAIPMGITMTGQGALEIIDGLSDLASDETVQTTFSGLMQYMQSWTHAKPEDDPMHYIDAVLLNSHYDPPSSQYSKLLSEEVFQKMTPETLQTMSPNDPTSSRWNATILLLMLQQHHGKENANKVEIHPNVKNFLQHASPDFFKWFEQYLAKTNNISQHKPMDNLPSHHEPFYLQLKHCHEHQEDKSIEPMINTKEAKSLFKESPHVSDKIAVPLQEEEETSRGYTS